MNRKLNNKCVAVLVANGFEELEFTKPVELLTKAGAQVDVISFKTGKVKSWNKENWGKEFEVTKTLSDVNPTEYHALYLPGGVLNCDKLRSSEPAIDFVSTFVEEGKPVAAIGYGPLVLIETGKLDGKKVTCTPSVMTDVINAGAQWMDEKVVFDGGIITCAQPTDLEIFCDKFLAVIETIETPAGARG